MMPSPTYLDFQPDYCDAHLRRQVAQWLDVSCAAHGFDDSVLTQAMNLFDRFLSVYQIDAGLGHWVPFLVGVAALSLAAIDAFGLPVCTNAYATGDVTYRWFARLR